MHVSDQEFDEIISAAMDELPRQFIEGLKNVAITYADEPTSEQRKKLKLRCNETLFGLYEGIPRTGRPAVESILAVNTITLPDKITLFKYPMIHASGGSHEEFKRQVKHTLWHEIAHYYGLNHDRIHAIENGELR